MAWEYKSLPEPLLLPACPHCTNRGRVSMILRGVFFCSDCGRPFVAVWRADRPVPLREEVRDATG